MKPIHAHLFARHLLKSLPTSFPKPTITVCDKLAPGELVIKVNRDDHERVKAALNEEHPDGTKERMTDLLTTASAVGVVAANGELFINTAAFLKSLMDHGTSKTMETALKKMEFAACCSIKDAHLEQLQKIERLTEEMDARTVRIWEALKKGQNPPRHSGGDSDGSDGEGNGNGNGISWWRQVGSWFGLGF